MLLCQKDLCTLGFEAALEMVCAELQHVGWLMLEHFAFESSNLVRVGGGEGRTRHCTQM